MFPALYHSIRIIWKYTPVLAVCRLLSALFAALCTALSLFVLQWTADGIPSFLSGSRPLSDILLLCAALFVTMALPLVLTGYADGMLHIRMTRQLNEKLSMDVIQKFMRLPYIRFEDPAFQDTLLRMSQKPDEMLLRLFETSVSVICQLVTLLGTLGIFLQLSPEISISFALLFVPLTWLNFKTADMMNSIYNEQSGQQRKMAYLEQLFSDRNTLYELKIFSAADYIARRWRTLTDLVLKQRIRVKIRAHYYYLAGNLLTFLWLAAILFFLCKSTFAAQITMGSFMAALLAINQGLTSSEDLYMALQQLRWRANIAAHFQIFMAMEDMPQPADLSAKPAADVSAGHSADTHTSHSVDGCPAAMSAPDIVFEHVSFSYPGSKKAVLHDVSFCIRGGEHIALVGENGAGKSTIIRLLCRLYEPSGGRILIGGQDIRTLSHQELNRIISVVFQDFNRFWLSLRENVAAGNLNEKQDNDRIRQVLAMAGMEWPGDLDIPLGKLEENGTDLSGGQWQRIAIARAYFSNACFIALDEPTAALDPAAESEIYQNMSNMMQHRSCIFISHRMASARMAHRILVLSDGRITEEGTHQQLLAQNGIYARMYQAQSQWYS